MTSRALAIAAPKAGAGNLKGPAILRTSEPMMELDITAWIEGGATLLEVEIRDEDPGDYARVYEIERSAFGSTLQADLVEALRDQAHPKLSLVALLENEIAGHIFFSPVEFESETAPPAAQLSPVAVAPSRQGLGIGSELIRAGLDRCTSKGWLSVFLLGNPLYYARFGFQLASSRGFSCGGPHDPFLQYRELRTGVLSGLGGLVRFHPVFSEFEPG